MKGGRGVIAAILLQAGIVCGLCGFRWMIVSGGERVSVPAVIESRFPDPRIPELILRYGVSSLPLRSIGGDGGEVGRMVRVSLAGEGSPKVSERGAEIRGVVTHTAESTRSWEVVIQSLEGTRSLFTPSWFGFQEGDMVYGCVDPNGVLQHVDRLEGDGSCWDKEWRRIEGRVVSARESRGSSVRVRYGMERFHPPPGPLPDPGSETVVQVSVRWGFPVVTRISATSGD